MRLGSGRGSIRDTKCTYITSINESVAVLCILDVVGFRHDIVLQDAVNAGRSMGNRSVARRAPHFFCPKPRINHLELEPTPIVITIGQSLEVGAQHARRGST